MCLCQHAHKVDKFIQNFLFINLNICVLLPSSTYSFRFPQKHKECSEMELALCVYLRVYMSYIHFETTNFFSPMSLLQMFGYIALYTRIESVAAPKTNQPFFLSPRLRHHHSKHKKIIVLENRLSE